MWYGCSNKYKDEKAQVKARKTKFECVWALDHITCGQIVEFQTYKF
jgi:hypothetical protein